MLIHFTVTASCLKPNKYLKGRMQKSGIVGHLSILVNPPCFPQVIFWWSPNER